MSYSATTGDLDWYTKQTGGYFTITSGNTSANITITTDTSGNYNDYLGEIKWVKPTPFQINQLTPEKIEEFVKFYQEYLKICEPCSFQGLMEAVCFLQKIIVALQQNEIMLQRIFQELDLIFPGKKELIQLLETNSSYVRTNRILELS